MVKGMRDPKRIDRILALIGELWKKHPDQRLSLRIQRVIGE